MKTQSIQESFDGWLRVETWHTHHPLDQGRFNRALGKVMENVGSDISEAEFEEAIRLGVQKHHPAQNSEHYEEAIRSYAQQASQIADYLADNDM